MNAFDGLQDLYHQHRPSYPDPAVQFALESVALASGDQVLDVGSGTGILTRALRRLAPAKVRVAGLEPNRDMRREALRATPAGAAIDYLEGAAEQLPFERLALITCGQALHWFDRPAFYAECLRTGAGLAALENNRDWRTDAFMDSYESLLEELSAGAYSRRYRDLDHEAELTAAGFARVSSARFAWQRPMALEAFLGLCLSSSKVQGIARRVGEPLLRERIQALAGDSPQVAVPYVTLVIVGRSA